MDLVTTAFGPNDVIPAEFAFCARDPAAPPLHRHGARDLAEHLLEAAVTSLDVGDVLPAQLPQFLVEPRKAVSAGTLRSVKRNVALAQRRFIVVAP